jgi:hypothetical protein
MAMTVISVDTETQECVLTVNGVLVPADEVFFSKYIDYDGNVHKDLTYSVETSNVDGVKQRTQFTMVRKDDPEYSSENSGLVAKEIKDKGRLYEELQAFVSLHSNKATI